MSFSLANFKYAMRSFRLLMVTVAGAFACAQMLSAQVVETYSFEDGTADGWISFYNASTPVATTAAAYSGSYSLLTTTSSTGTGGPSIQLSERAAGRRDLYHHRLGDADQRRIRANAELHHRAQRSLLLRRDLLRHDRRLPGAGNRFRLGADRRQRTRSSTTETALAALCAAGGRHSAQSFYLDDVVITETAPPPGGTPIATYTFADGGLDGWTPFGSATLTNAAPPTHRSERRRAAALLTTNRTATYMGPSLNLLGVSGVVAGATYQVTRLRAAGRRRTAANPTVTMSTKMADCANPREPTATLATSGALSSTAWTKVQGTFSFSNLPGTADQPDCSTSSPSSATDSFYISDVAIGELVAAAAHPEPAGQHRHHHDV